MDVAGANGATFNTGPLAPVQNGLRVRCLVSAPGRTAISREAVVSVIPDIWPPSVRLTGNASLNEVWAIFSEPVGPATATAIQNYSINGLQIQTARMHHSDPRIVILNTAPQTPGTRFDWAVSGVRDPSTAQNELPPTTGTFAAWTLQLGWVRRELWTNIFGGKVADLTNHVKFPDHPDRVNYLPSVEAPANVADAYGQRLSGWLQVTNTGDFNFAIAADDQAVLYLSTDESPANKRAIVTEPEWGRERDWNSSDRRLASPGDDFFPAIDALPVNRSENTTGPIHLIVGERYYFEVLHKDGGGGDHAEVTMWPAGGLPPANGTPGIPGAQVWNFVNPDNQITITQQPEEMIVWPGAAAGFSTLAVALEGPVFYQWERNGVPISNALWRILDVPSGLAGAGGEVYRCRISAPGASASTVSVRLTVLESRHWNVQPSTDGRWRLLWRDDGNPQRLQTTTHLLPGAQWMDIPWLQDHGWYYELSIDPQAPGAGPQRFFRALPTE